MCSSMSVNIVLFDLGNVILDWQPIRLYRQVFDSKAEAHAFCRNVCTLEWHTAHDRGISFADNAKPLIARHPHYHNEINLWRTGWLDMFEGYVPGMPELVERLHESGAPLYGLSNLPQEIAEETFDAYPVIHRLRDVVVSGAERVVKPDPKIYQIALRRMGNPPPESVLFIDDRAENIAAADRLGFATHLFKGADGLQARLTALALI